MNKLQRIQQFAQKQVDANSDEAALWAQVISICLKPEGDAVDLITVLKNGATQAKAKADVDNSDWWRGFSAGMNEAVISIDKKAVGDERAA
jgi:hypothetical protein